MLSSVINKVNQVIHHKDDQFFIDWSDTLAGMTHTEALHEVKEQLLKISELKKISLLQKLEMVFSADESSYYKVQKLTHDYLIVNEENAGVRHEIESAVYEYLRQLYSMYTKLIVEYQQLDQSVLNAQQVNLLLARYLNSAFMMAKWRYFDGEAAPMGLWNNVHQIIKIAEGLSVMNTQLFLYEAKNKETSIAAILKRGFLLDTLQRESYSQFQIELTDRILKIWSTNPVIGQRLTKQHEYQFFIHLEKDKRPQRVRGAKQHSDFRYWSTLRIIDLIEQYLCAVDTRKSLAPFNLEGLADTQHVTALFKKLRVDWCVNGYKRQRRDEDRTAQHKVLSISHGIDNICSRLSSLQRVKRESINAFGHKKKVSSYPLLTLGLENWTMLEESHSGFSVVLDKQIQPWVKSGALIAYAESDSVEQLKLAEVKTVRKRKDGSYRVGLLKILGDAVAVRANKLEKNTSTFQSLDGYIVDDGQDNLLLNNAEPAIFIDTAYGKPQMIMARYAYKRATRYIVDADGQTHSVLAGDVKSAHRQWIAFEIIK